MPECRLVRNGTIAVATFILARRIRRIKGIIFCVRHRDDFESVEFASVLLALQRTYHFGDEIVNIEQFQFDTWVVYCDRQVVCYVVAEGRDGTVVVWTAQFAVEVREAID
mgnify:CR=1 FL=1